MPYRRLLLALTLAMTPIGVAAVRADVVVRVEGRVFDGGGIVDFDDPVEVTYTVRPGAVGLERTLRPTSDRISTRRSRSRPSSPAEITRSRVWGRASS
jgi:hypothetical protein